MKKFKLESLLLVGFIIMSPSILNAQIEVISKSKVELIGEFKRKGEDGRTYSASLKRERFDDRYLYILSFNPHSNNENKYGVVKFLATSNEINLLYKTIAEDFKNIKHAKTEIKVGDEYIETGYSGIDLLLAINSNSSPENDLKIRLFGIAEILVDRKDWAKLFGKQFY